MDDPARRGRERLIRKLLTLPNKPAIIQYHYTPLVFKDFRCVRACPAAVQALRRLRGHSLVCSKTCAAL